MARAGAVARHQRPRRARAVAVDPALTSASSGGPAPAARVQAKARRPRARQRRSGRSLGARARVRPLGGTGRGGPATAARPPRRLAAAPYDSAAQPGACGRTPAVRPQPDARGRRPGGGADVAPRRMCPRCARAWPWPSAWRAALARAAPCTCTVTARCGQALGRPRRRRHHLARGRLRPATMDGAATAAQVRSSPGCTRHHGPHSVQSPAAGLSAGQWLDCERHAAPMAIADGAARPSAVSVRSTARPQRNEAGSPRAVQRAQEWQICSIINYELGNCCSYLVKSDFSDYMK
jgi:hypothetical protein